mgnify:CR=1 FL=1
MSLIYSLEAQNIDGKAVSLSEYKDKVLLVVNVASKCGFTGQYKSLQSIYERYKEKGFEILAFPCNQFGAQEPGNESEIKEFCDINYKITFPLFSKIDVNGENTHPLYQYIKPLAPGVMGSEAIKWNFTKFLIDKNGQVLERYAPTTAPESIVPKIEAALSLS